MLLVLVVSPLAAVSIWYSQQQPSPLVATWNLHQSAPWTGCYRMDTGHLSWGSCLADECSTGHLLGISRADKRGLQTRGPCRQELLHAQLAQSIQGLLFSYTQ